MAVREILKIGDPRLWEKSLMTDDHRSAETISLTDDLRDTLAAFREVNGYGRGIAAPQIGVSKRVIYINMPSDEFSGPLINPEIVWQDERRLELWDACFSIPGLMVRVSRAGEVEVEYTDLVGDRLRIKAGGDLAELLQHEIDHLDGWLMIHRALSPRAFATREEWIRQGRPK